MAERDPYFLGHSVVEFVFQLGRPDVAVHESGRDAIQPQAEQQVALR